MTAPSAKTTVLLVDDHRLLREGLRACLAADPGLEVIGEAGDGDEGVRLAHALRPDVVLLDINMPRMSGLEAAAILRRDLPDVRILILTMHTHTEYAVETIRVGAHGHVTKDAAPEELCAAIHRVAGGLPNFGVNATVQFLQRFRPSPSCVVAAPNALTQRERQVLTMIAGGLTNRAIATQLALGIRTVETYRERLMRKLNIRHVAGLVQYANATGLVDTNGGAGPPR